MIHLLVDGDYFLSGLTLTSEETVREGVDNLLNAISSQLFTPATMTTTEQRVVFFSSSIMRAVEEQQARREVLITALRRLRFQTIILDSIPNRAGSPVDAAICTKTMSILAKSQSNVVIGGGGSGGNGKSLTLVYFASNAYISPALQWAQDAGCGVCFVVYSGDTVADELMAYVSPMYGGGGGIAAIAKGEGINFIPNTEAASVALATLQHEGKELPLAVLLQLKQLQQRLTTTTGQKQSQKGSDTAMHAKSPPYSSSPSYYVSSVVPVGAPSRVVHPPPIAGAPDPFAPDDDKSNNEALQKSATAPSVGSQEEMEMEHLALESKKNKGTDPTTTATNGNNITIPTSGASQSTVKQTETVAMPPVPVNKDTAVPGPSASPPVQQPDNKTTTSYSFPEPEVSTRLPAGWALMYDRQRRRHYYVHTGADRILRTTWTHPNGVAEQMDVERQVEEWYRKQQERRQVGGTAGNGLNAHTTSSQSPVATTTTTTTSLPSGAASGWDECVDPKSGRTYYVNRQTKQTSWTLPTAAVGGIIRNNDGGSVEGSKTTPLPVSADASTLPPFWEERVDPKTGRTFYVNH